MLAAITPFSVVLVRQLNMFPIVACLFFLTLDYTWCFAKSQAQIRITHILLACDKCHVKPMITSTTTYPRTQVYFGCELRMCKHTITKRTISSLSQRKRLYHEDKHIHIKTTNCGSRINVCWLRLERRQLHPSRCSPMELPASLRHHCIVNALMYTIVWYS